MTMSVAAPVPLWGNPKISPVTVPETALSVGSLEKEKVKLSARAVPQAKRKAEQHHKNALGFMMGTLFEIFSLWKESQTARPCEDLDVIVLT